MEQNVIYINQPKSRINRNGSGAIIRIDKEAADILEQMACAANRSVSTVASKLIKFGADNTIIKEGGR